MMGDDLDEIKRLPIRDVAVRLGIRVLRGNKAMCFGGHDKRTPSLSFSQRKNIWKCFGCPRKGDTIALVMSVLDCDFKAALKWFAREFHVNVRRDRGQRHHHRPADSPNRHRVEPEFPRAVPNERQEFSPDSELYSWFVDKCGVISERVGLNYLRDHGIPTATANKFGVRELRDPAHALRRLVEQWGAERVFRSGLAWGHGGIPSALIWASYTVLFPFYIDGKVVFVQGRRFNKEPKYLNPRGIAKPLYNIDRIRSLPRGRVIHICEGVPDALALEGFGIAAVAVLGASSFHAEWVDHFIPYDVVLTPDGDAGGKTFGRTVSGFFMARGKTIRTAWSPTGTDVAEVIADMRRAKWPPS